ncbi:BMP family ABC transporter substrate-binding protein [Streptomyces sp. MUM 136J]|uniref:BMP family ABC transporter substrate-binding protein n=1 Tax=Streptomyces sp. MUM 136J TaxID=2791992 RepID=UPI001F03A9C6|nr:BMP family ABC transporter substrate-binding protein [Streptomyces sp. MUM 136J]MCH0570983.1 BMP family ABC transporter substrate-binding protein [Streptomyces sp. MUM 136J]
MKTRRAWRMSARKTPPRSGATARRLLRTAGSALRGRRGLAVTGAAAVTLALLGVRAFTGDEKPAPPDPRARQYRDFDACLLTDDKGITAGAPAAPVWAGMQEASSDTRIRVTYVPVMGDQSEAAVRPVFNGLVQRRCEVILAAGSTEVKVAQEEAARNPEVRFVLLDGTREASNITNVRSGEATEKGVSDAIRRTVDAGDA